MAELPRPGAFFEGRYRLDQVLGEGAFARVYRAMDVSMNHQVALKILKPVSQDKNFETVAARFAREMKLVGTLTDPHIVQMFDFGRTADGFMYMVLELVEGRDLSEVVAGGPVPEHVALHVLVQLLYALREAHRQGLLHRDIKPANIRMHQVGNDPYRVKLLDFGIAKPRDEDAKLTATGMVVGTPRFMAPEQIYGEELTPSSDLYALALVIVEMLSTEKLDYLKHVANQRAVTIPPNAAVSDAFRGVVDRMLDPEPQGRYRDADAVLRALSSAGLTGTPRVPTPGDSQLALGHQSDAAASAPTIVQMPQHARPQQQTEPDTHRPNPLVIGGLGTAVVGVLVIGAFALGRDSAARHSAPPPASQRVNPMTNAPSPSAVVAPAPPAPTVDAAVDAEQVDPRPLTDGCGTDPAWRDGVMAMVSSDPAAPLTWWVHVPKNYDANVRHPVLWAFHDSASSPTNTIRQANWKELADQGNYVIVAPQHDQVMTPWHGADANPAIAGAKRALAETSERLCLDLNRVFIISHGWGGSAGDRLACKGDIAGVVTASWVPKKARLGCTGRADPVPHLFIGPTKSKFLPVEGGRDCVNINRIAYSQFDELWLERNECTRVNSTKFFEHQNGTCERYECASGAPYVSCRVSGGRGWPGSKPREVDFFQCDGTPAKFPQNELVAKFLKSIDPVAKQ